MRVHRLPLTLVALLVLVLLTFLPVAARMADAAGPDGPHGKPEPPMLGIHYARGQQAKPQAGKPSPLLAYRGGQVITAALQVTPIYWGTSWNGYSGDKITGLAAFYQGAGGSPYMGTNTEYTDASGAHVVAAVSYVTHIIDATAAPSSAPSTSAVLAVVAKNFPNPDPNAYYPVYSDQKRGAAGYCAWHSWGSVNGVPIEFGFFFNLDGDAGCDPNDTTFTHSQGLEALANVTGHELSETVTDPRGGGWVDRSGAENADKCAWTFGSSRVFLGSTSWKVQGNWSNAAYSNNSGYTRGCIDGN